MGISFAGNHYFDDEILRSRVRIQPAGFDSPGRFSSAQLASDVASITDLYQANGFRSVHVNGEVQQNYRGKSEDLFVRFEVQEGPQTRVADLKIEGNKALSDSRTLARDRLRSRPAIFRFQRRRRSGQCAGAVLRPRLSRGPVHVLGGRAARSRLARALAFS